MKLFYRDYTIGLLGGGQLGQMLIEAGIKFNLDIDVLDPDPNASCKLIANHFSTGLLTDFETIYSFGKNKNLITIEIEHINTDALKKLESEGIDVFPQPDTIALIQDKRAQKAFYKKHHIPTSDYIVVSSRDEIYQHIDFLPAVQKLAYAGYDGRGVQKIQTTKDIKKGFDQPSILEKTIAIEKEISIIVARNKKGDIATYPAVELIFNQEHNVVDYLLAPARIDPATEKQATELAIGIAEQLNLVGVLAVELFLTTSHQLLVNEIAPRPHNSGHHTIEGCLTSQFEQHWRAILNLPLGNTSLRTPCGIINLLGAAGSTGPVVYQGIEDILKLKNCFVHLYGKKQTKPFRKMGHITILGDSTKEIEKQISSIKKQISITT